MLSVNEDKTQFLKKSSGEEKTSKKTKTSKGGDYEDFISKDSLKNTYYRVAIRNLDFKQKKSVKFTLRIDIQEKVFIPNQSFKENLPKSIDEIQRVKIKPEGLKESEFIAGTKYMVSWMNENALNPFIPKTSSTF